MTFSNATFRTSLAACTLWLATGPAHAVDLNSQDLIPAPAGTDAVLGYFTYATRDSFTPTGGGELKQETGLDSFVSIFRYVHYMDVGGFTVAPQVLLPYGRLYNGSLNGVRLDSASGLGDPILAAPVWLVNNPSTTFAIVPYLYLPAGSYDAGRTLNVGENRWKFDLQLGGVQQLGNGFATQLSTDVMWYGVNDDASGIGTGRLKQDNTYQFQGWVTWPPVIPNTGAANSSLTVSRTDRRRASIRSGWNYRNSSPPRCRYRVCSSATSTSMAVLRKIYIPPCA